MNDKPLVTTEAVRRFNIRLIRSKMKTYKQYSDKEWFILKDLLDQEYARLPKDARAC